jgi:phosphoglycolate phosphatase
MHYRLAIFDFDGTLADSFPFFLSVHNSIADRHGFRRIEPHEVAELRHRPTREIIKRAGLPFWKLPMVAQSFTAAMRERAHEIAVFDGVHAALERLQERGVTLALVTSNAIENVRLILGAATLARFAHLECGASMFGKATLIKRTTKKIGIDAGATIYIGDQLVDAEAAREADVAFGAVAWGYASVEALTAARPDILFETVADLERIAAPSG